MALVKNMQRKRLPAIVDMFVWEKRTKGKAGIRWDKVVENIWKEIGGNVRDNVHKGRRGVQNKSKRHDRIKGKESAETGSRRGRAPQDIWRVERGDKNENIPTRPNGLCEKLETAISDRRP